MAYMVDYVLKTCRISNTAVVGLFRGVIKIQGKLFEFWPEYPLPNSHPQRPIPPLGPPSLLPALKASARLIAMQMAIRCLPYTSSTWFFFATHRKREMKSLWWDWDPSDFSSFYLSFSHSEFPPSLPSSSWSSSDRWITSEKWKMGSRWPVPDRLQA